MALYFIKDTTLTNIAKAIRSKTGSTASIPVSQMAAKISSIVTGGGSGEGEGGVASFISDSGSFNTANVGTGRQTIQHGLGVKPDFIVVYLLRTPDYTATSKYCALFNTSKKTGIGGVAFTGSYSFGTAGSLEERADDSQIYCPNDYSFSVGSDDFFVENTQYFWKAIAVINAEDSAGGDHTVTFMSEDGTRLLCRKGVMDGDTCGNPVTTGIISEPTKESSAEYTYSFAGWSTTPGGEANPDALANIKKDTTVYAAFNQEIRKYTINYYDGETLLNSEQLPYGATPAYVPEKSGYFFSGWTPSLKKVTADANYQVIWETIPKFSTATWDQISKISSEGKASQYFAVGDTKTITLTDGTTRMLKIIGFDHDDLSDGSGKAGITMCSTNTWYSFLVSFNSSQKKYNNVTSYTAGGWTLSDLRTRCNETIFNTLPDDFKSVVKTVNKISDAGDSDKTAFRTTQDKVWIWCPEEIGFAPSSGYLQGQGTKYPYFTSKATRQIAPSGSTCQGYALRSAHTQSFGNITAYHQNDNVTGLSAAGSHHIVPCFCV